MGGLCGNLLSLLSMASSGRNSKTATAQAQLAAAGKQLSVGKQALQHSTEALSQSNERERLGTIKPFEVFQSQP